MALYHFKASGEFDAAVREWENKASADKRGQTSKLSYQQNIHATRKQTK